MLLTKKYRFLLINLIKAKSLTVCKLFYEQHVFHHPLPTCFNFHKKVKKSLLSNFKQFYHLGYCLALFVYREEVFNNPLFENVNGVQICDYLPNCTGFKLFWY